MKTIRWGILSTGTIARNFAETAKKMADVKITAGASRSQKSADRFGYKYGIAHCHEGYEALAADPDVDIVYVATPHSRHYEDVKLMIEHGKHVLCEKSFTVDAAQADALSALAKEKVVFLMESFWTKFCPVYREVERVIKSGAIGEIRAVTAQYGYTTAREARKFDPALAGGTLLDIGVYAIGFACMMLGYEMDEIRSNLIMNGAGTDAYDAITMRRGDAIAQLTCAIGAQIPLHGAVYGTKGYIDIPDFKNPQKATVFYEERSPQVFVHAFEVNGFEYEIREAMDCVREGKTQSSLMTPAQSIAVMRIMDEIRAQNGLRFPFEQA